MKDLFKNLKFAWKYSKDDKIYLIIVLTFYLVNIILSVITPILSAKIIIELTNNNYIQIIIVALTIFIVDIISDIGVYIIRRCSVKIYRNTLSRLEIDLGTNILKIENKCLDENGTGVFIQRLTNDTSRLASVFNSILGEFSELIKYIGILISLLIVNKLVFIYVFIMLTIIYLIENKRTKVIKNEDRMVRKSKERVSSFIGELVRGTRDIKMLNSEKDFINELANRTYDVNDKELAMHKKKWGYKIIIFHLINTTSFLLIVLLVILMSKNIILPSIALVLYNYATRVYSSIFLIGDLLENIQEFNLSSERIYALMNDKEFPKEKFGTIQLDKINGDFEFKNVSFGYTDKLVLNDLSFKIKANETVAFVGKSGAGKTTIFNLLCKMYDVNYGEITIDNVNIKDLDKESIRGNITIISQNPYIFNMSIRDNLKLVKSDLVEEDMINACKTACLDDFINELPDKYDTIVGEGGVNLSGGQKQRLAIARALVQKTEIILFDEATSSLDNETQQKIQEAINSMKNEYTILIIAHRLSTIINADRILYLENGKIEAEGTHKELLKKCKNYKMLYESEIQK